MDRQFTLLIVEDDSLILQALAQPQRWLKLGYALIGTADSAEKALELAMSNPPDVVLTDICMNGLSGLDLIEMLRARCPETMYVILSGYSEFEYARRALQLGVFEYLTKPIDNAWFDTIFAQLHAHLTKRRQCADSVSAARREFVIDILNREMDSVYLRERLFSLRLGEEAQWYRVILLEGTIVDQNALVNHFGLSSWQHIVLGRRHALILASSSGIVPELQLRAYLDDQPSVHAGVGGRQKLQNLHRSRQEAEWALDRLFFTGESLALSGTMPHCDHIAITRYSDAIVQAWTELDERVMNAAIKDYFRFVRIQGAGRNAVLLNTTNILSRISSKLGEGQQPEQSPESVQESLMNTSTVDQLESLTTSILLNLQANCRSSLPIVQDGLAGHACAYIEEHIEERITLSDIAAHLFVNPSYLSRTFKQAIGDNVNHYITHKKIARAKADMRNLNLGIREIAQNLGFTDYSYFCVQFKKETGKTPLNYRKRILYGDGTEKKT